jgi:hypothetical protein
MNYKTSILATIQEKSGQFGNKAWQRRMSKSSQIGQDYLRLARIAATA